jgi:hypothetical protein
MDKHAKFKLKLKRVSNRKVAKLANINRKTVARYWNEYLKQKKDLEECNHETKEIQEEICKEPIYNSNTRKARRYSKEINQSLDEILENESEKCKELGSTNKQQLTNIQIHKMICIKGFDISYSTICIKLREKRNKSKECFIKQQYEFGDRLEYDFGEVRLTIDGITGIYYIAVLSSPASNFRWAYLYKNQKQDVFMNSHVEFFEMVGGVYKEVVYDNMKNVVTKFIGRNEKQLNEQLLKLSLYYGFEINVTNCFRGNEKGHVEGSVKIIRNVSFALNYRFKTFDEAKNYLQTQLIVMNESSNIKEEIKQLLPKCPKLDLAKVTIVKVNKYSFVRIDNNHYSVPEHLVEKKVTAKRYYDVIRIYSNNVMVCEHKRIDGRDKISIDIKHYLKSLNRKPGALKNSLALKSVPKLKAIYDEHFSTNPKEFIETIQKNNNKNLNELIEILKMHDHSTIAIATETNQINKFKIEAISKNQVSEYAKICMGGGSSNGY